MHQAPQACAVPRLQDAQRRSLEAARHGREPRAVRRPGELRRQRVRPDLVRRRVEAPQACAVDSDFVDAGPAAALADEGNPPSVR
jgi:hypothetical protein